MIFEPMPTQDDFVRPSDSIDRVHFLCVAWNMSTLALFAMKPVRTRTVPPAKTATLRSPVSAEHAAMNLRGVESRDTVHRPVSESKMSTAPDSPRVDIPPANSARCPTAAAATHERATDREARRHFRAAAS